MIIESPVPRCLPHFFLSAQSPMLLYSVLLTVFLHSNVSCTLPLCLHQYFRSIVQQQFYAATTCHQIAAKGDRESL